ncbi:UxaA family hydrolase [Thermohalobacter berrensis]|uniref:Carbohydrate hydrolase n=1 Tax=Thermohalobacter berrensis TaxID=99594 RepID=A0A419T1H0_9FIRM|nr:UxaA family hydrolase [Thermohalobacter berrensis]RKD31268.1 carbohydrate hydrolase [Thermohalobacter berrensis]
MKIMGYRRPNGKIGIRNHIVVLPTSVCASETATRISNLVEGTVALTHQHGCCQVGADHQQTVRTLIGLGNNPNVGAVLVVGLGCEGVEPTFIAEEIGKTGKPVEMITIQGCGGTLKTIEKGTRILKNMAQKILNMPREEVDISEITLGIECGGTDTTSGIAANPAAGTASDMLLNYGGTAMLSETTELIGAEHILAKRAVNDKVAQKLLDIVKKTEERAMSLGVDIRGSQPTPGNIEGGVTTIEEKSLGCIYKAGSAPIQGVLKYGEPPEDKGFYVMDTPGQDIESITGMLAGGAQVIIFTTGRGTPTGAPIAPVIKITGNSNTFKNMIDNIDINAGKVIDQGVSIKQVGKEIFNEIVSVCNGKLTKAEILKHREFGIYKIAPTF